ncbi:hypothetical protein TEA_008434 [Camellia sinensis var. sinensis]|uniref:Uncharacterized protein n=1 Tax=Camellia sinensis var. sinensis TaxID=542762 RepID=A0A4S4DCN8_CAMSN|nr:hypothetical protein TEA_008434 [Camellia sinensis var. sinensis]
MYAIVRDMIAAGLGLNKFCYAGLIAAHKNKTPITDDTATKIIELVEQSKGWSSVEGSRDNAENFMMGISEEELYNTPTAEYVHRRSGFLHRELTVYHVAFYACANLRNVEVMETILEMVRRDNKTPDVFILMQVISSVANVICEPMLCALSSAFVLYFLCESFLYFPGAMVGYIPKGMQLALETLENMTSRDFFFSPKMGNDLLLVAAGEKDLMQARKIIPSPPAVEAYYNGLKLHFESHSLVLRKIDSALQFTDLVAQVHRKRAGGFQGIEFSEGLVLNTGITDLIAFSMLSSTDMGLFPCFLLFQERFYFGDNVLPCFESGIPMLKNKLQELPDLDNPSPILVSFAPLSLSAVATPCPVPHTATWWCRPVSTATIESLTPSILSKLLQNLNNTIAEGY